MSGHTPGPWFVRYCDDSRHMCMTVVSTKDYGPSNEGQFDDDADTVAIAYHQCQPFVSGGFEINDCDERDANARLIAAAPMLLEACELFAEYDSVEHDDFETMVVAYASAIEAARAAIAAATGETK